METVLSEIRVMCVLAESGPKGAARAFSILESKLPSLKGRRFYGTILNGVYKACVKLEPDDEPQRWGFEISSISGGRYAREKIGDWGNRLHLVGPTFEKMATTYQADPDRPAVEFYRSQKELILFLPIR